MQIDSDGYDYENVDGTGTSLGASGGDQGNVHSADEDSVVDDEDAQMWIMAIAVTSVLLVIVMIVIIGKCLRL